MPALFPPIYGAADNTTFKRTPQGFCPVERLRNVRVYNPKSNRPQVGKRAGLGRVIPGTIGTGAVQALCSVSLASRITGYVPGVCTLIDSGTSSQADELNGNAWLLDSSPGMTRAHFPGNTIIGIPAISSSSVVAWHPSGDKYAIATVFPNSTTGIDQAYVLCYRASDGELLWSKLVNYLSFGEAPPVESGTRVVSMAFSHDYLFIAARARVLVVKADDGTSPLGSVYAIDCNGWSSETIAVSVHDDRSGTFTPNNTRETLFVAFMGSLNGGTVTNGAGSFTVDAGTPASHWRAGVMKFTIRSQAVVTLGSLPLVQATFGTLAADTSRTHYEAAHSYCRISERSRNSPRGCRITGMSVGPGGVVYLSRTTHGFGPNASGFPPNGTGDGIDEVTVMKLSTAGLMVWETSTLGVLAGEANDIPPPPGSSTTGPAIRSIAADRAGNVFAVGRVNIAGHSLFKIRGSDGALLWATSTQDTGEVAYSVSVDPADGNPVIAGQQNDDWGTSKFAHLWKLASDTAEVLWGFPNTTTAAGLGNDVDAFAVAVSHDGQIIYGTGKVTGTPGSGGEWTYQDGYWIQAASVPTVLIAPAMQRQPMQIRIRGGNIAARLYAVTFASGDGRTRIRAGVKDNTNLAIDSVEFGDTVTNFATGAHGLSTGQVFTLDVKITNNTIGIYINGSSTAALVHTLTAPQLAQFGRLRHFGFESAVANARVLLAEYCALQAETAAGEELLIAVCDGNAFAIADTEGGPFASLLKTGAFNETGGISLTEFEQHVYGVDGTHFVDIDAVERTVEPFGDATGDGVVPGASEDPANPGQFLPGTTRMTIITTALSRLAVAGDPRDPQNLWESGVGTPADWNTASVDRTGRAFATTSDLPSRIGEPIVALEQITKGVMLIGCTNSIWRMIGDPALGIPDISPVALTMGVSGPRAITTIADGRALVHTPEGIYLIGSAGDPLPLSEGILNEGLQINREDVSNYLIQTIRDARRHITHIFLTTVATGAVTHFAYDELIGAFMPRVGGFFPDVFPDSVGPTASTAWKGRVILGTRDGRLLWFDNDLADDDGEAIDATYPLEILDEGSEGHETILSQVTIVPARDSGVVTYKVYSGLTAEQVFVGDDRRLLLSGTASISGPPIKRAVRGAALLLELSNAVAGESFRIETVEALWRLGRLNPRRFTFPAPDVEAPSGAPVTPVEPEEPDSGGGTLVIVGPSISQYIDNGGGIGSVIMGAMPARTSTNINSTSVGIGRGVAGELLAIK